MQYHNYQGAVILLPTDDYVAATIDQHLDALEQFCLMPHVRHQQGAMVRLMNKDVQKEMAKAVGMNVAKGWLCMHNGKEYVIPEQIEYPCFAKPQSSAKRDLKTYMRRCKDENDLHDLLTDISSFYTDPILIEKFCPIDKEYAVLGVSTESGSVIPAIIQMKESREGVIAKGEVFPITDIEGLEQLLSAFLKKTQQTGLFDIDLYESEGKIYFNEFNVRFGASGYAVTKNVINLPELFIRHLMGENVVNDIVPQKFNKVSYVNEKVLRDMYIDRKLTFRQFKETIQMSETPCIYNADDIKPYEKFVSANNWLPLFRQMKHLKRMFRS